MNDQTNIPTGTPTGPRPPWSARRLLRSRHDRMIAGVAGGIAETYGIDPTLVRLGFVLAALVGGVGIVAYIAAWILVPETDDSGRAAPTERDWITIGGLVLLGFGALALFNHVAWHRGNEFVWPLLLIGGGAAVLWLRVRDDADEPPTPPTPPWPPGPSSAPRTTPNIADATPEATRATEPISPDEPASPSDPEPTESIAAVDVPPASTAAAASTTTAWAPPAPWPVTPNPYHPPRPPRPPREHSILGWLTLSVLLLGVGVVALLDAGGAIDANPGVVIAGALTTIGIALIVGAFWGRARWLILLAIPLTVVGALTAALDVPLRGGIGDRIERPATIDDVQSTYELGIGHFIVDLRGIVFRPGATNITANLGIGGLEVLVPRGVRVIVDGHVDAGEANLFGHPTNGTSVDAQAAVGPPGSARRLRIDVNVGLGNLQVRYEEDFVR